MNAPLSIAPAGNKSVAMQVLVEGRIDARRLHDGTFYTRFLTPAPDAYSRPQIVEVRSKKGLGQRGEETSVLCKLGGFTRKAFRVTDKETGEQSMVTPVDMTLDAVE